MSKAKILFLCTGNSARSQMAEALLRFYAGDSFEAHSAGLTLRPIHPYTLHVMAEIGLDLSTHRAKSGREFLGHKHFATLIIVCAQAETDCPTTFLGVQERLPWPFDDTAAVEGDESARLSAFRTVRDQIAAQLRGWLVEHGFEVTASLPTDGGASVPLPGNLDGH